MRYSSRSIVKRLLVAVAGAVLAGCASKEPQHSQLGKIYNLAAQRDKISRNPIIVIPGILGSYLKDEATGDEVWGVIGGRFDTDHTEQLAFPMAEGKSLAQLEDSTSPNGVLSRITVSVGARISVKAYAQMLQALGASGYRDQTLGDSGAVNYGNDHYTCFQFDYDWRRSCVENAARLGKFIAEKRAFVEAQHLKRFGTKGKIKFDIAAHSMGGLIARYFQMYGTQPLPADGSLPLLTWAGASQIDKVVLVAPPNGGSGEAFERLVNGYKPTRVTSRFQAGLLATMPALYELLPRERHDIVVKSDGTRVPIFDPEVWEKNQWGLSDPRQADTLATILPDITDPAERRRIAVDHQRKCLINAKRFQAAIDRPTKLPKGASLYLFAGDSEPTAGIITVSPDSSVRITETAPGDYSVTRRSALLDERKVGAMGRLETPIDWTQVTFLYGSHLQLTRDPTFIDNMLYLLLEK